jgi:YVTN family beta-propeller protein
MLRAGARVFVTCPEARTLVELDLVRFKPLRKLTLPGIIVTAVTHPDGKALIVVTEQPASLCVVDPDTLRVKKQTQLPESPTGLAVSTSMAAVASDFRGVTRVSLPDCRIMGATAMGSKCGALQFRADGKMILAGLTETKQILTLDVASGAALARLPLAFAPGRFSFNDNGGQMFVTGAGVDAGDQDAIAIVKPYQSEVDQTLVAGRTPHGMAVSFKRNLLLVTNPGSGDLTILDIETRRLSASVHMGGNPGEVLLTPDEEYALVIGQDSGDVSVVRMPTVLDRSVKTKPLFTVFPMGGKPRSAVIVPKEA